LQPVTLQDTSIDVGQNARAVAERALAEDGPVDVTSEVAGAAGVRADGIVEYRSGGVFAGLRYADEVANQCTNVHVDWSVADGEPVEAGAIIAHVSGDLAQILRAERPMLNILQRACGIASSTRRYVDAVAGTGCRVLHTRKTSPGLRGLEISAVLAGGGGLHRADLFHEVLLKDNHWHAVAHRGLDLTQVCDAARARGLRAIYVEVENEEQLRRACKASATRLLVDNQTPDTFKVWCGLARRLAPTIEMEASGGITSANVREFALAGADFVSIGALTHSVIAADLALEILEVNGE
jgi:nicotinate-nucleotide pyrophosphorylase (carboxylating)